MEDEKSFNLEQALDRWRITVKNYLALRTSDVEELEAHLRDSIQTLQTKGLGLEEAFLIASQRLGQSQELGREYRKARHRLVWLEEIRNLAKPERRELYQKYWGGAFRHWQIWLALAIAIALPHYFVIGGDWLFNAQAHPFILKMAGWLIGYTGFLVVLLSFIARDIREVLNIQPQKPNLSTKGLCPRLYASLVTAMLAIPITGLLFLMWHHRLLQSLGLTYSLGIAAGDVILLVLIWAVLRRKRAQTYTDRL